MAKSDNEVAVTEVEENQQDKAKGEIDSLKGHIAEAFLSLQIVGVLMVLTALGSGYAEIYANLTSPFMMPAFIIGLLGNQIYFVRTNRKAAKLAEMVKSYESRYGALPSK